MTHDRRFFQIWKAALKPLKIIAKCSESSGGSFSVLFLKGAPQVVLDESASDSIDVHVQRSVILLGIPDSKIMRSKQMPFVSLWVGLPGIICQLCKNWLVISA